MHNIAEKTNKILNNKYNVNSTNIDNYFYKLKY